ncbi:NnrS family protein [Algisphaera agarilytica]|uniref:Uncharacterized protein involved in response to NO n=1 Tax=Algisphaera agarilytica TaxID=1385975 RepID=A0A7X0H8G7_9BACT|nr:NnrS family protein [Algisphaera agarilytica]MBB6431053.1 uncharacterized protein involved in response to NO [Algisphaera agarilytica]
MIELTVLGQGENQEKHGPAIWDAGFRPFFFGAAATGVVSILLWAWVYAAGGRVPLQGMTSFDWHGHEMVYGYTLAVIAGFLLTAVEKWTGVPLAVLAGLWLGGRLCMLPGTALIAFAVFFDMLFVFGLFGMILWPIVQAQAWAKCDILGKLAVSVVGQCVFSFGVLLDRPDWVRFGLWAGLLMSVGLTIAVARKIVPIFIKYGLENAKPVRNIRALDWSSLLLFTVYFVADLTRASGAWIAWPCLALFVVLTARLLLWHQFGIWRKPLLWGIWLGLLWINVGFLLRALGAWGMVIPALAIHAWAYGGMGLTILAMMGRVSLGHTNRSVHRHPVLTGWMIAALTLGSVVRVVFPMVWIEHYLTWVVVAQVLWVVSLVFFLIAYGPMLWRPDAESDAHIPKRSCGAKPVGRFGVAT